MLLVFGAEKQAICSRKNYVHVAIDLRLTILQNCPEPSSKLVMFSSLVVMPIMKFFNDLACLSYVLH